MRRVVLLLAALLMLAARPGWAQATSHWSIKPGTLVYLDGQRTTAAVVEQVPNEAVDSVEGIRGKPGMAADFGDSTATNVLVVITKNNTEAPATLALSDRAHLSSAYRTRPATMQDVAPVALSYITSHYPKCWLGGEVLELTRKSSGAVTYRVQLANNWGWRYVSFTAAGDFVNDRQW